MMASQTTLDEKFEELQEPKLMHQNSHPKIQKVAEYLRNRKKFEKKYSPKLVSIGPIHHDSQNLKLGENYKLTWAERYIKTTQQSPQFLHKKIADRIDELKGLFADDVLALVDTAESLKGFDSLEEKLSWLLFVDGCSLLHILVNVNLDQLDEPEHLSIKVDQLVLVMMDVLLLENQLPYLVLKLLWKNGNENELINAMTNFLKCHHWATPETKTRKWQDFLLNKSKENEKKGKEEHPSHTVLYLPNESPIHLLDLQRKIILTKSNSKTEARSEAKEKKKPSGKNSDEKSKMMTYRNIQDLRAVGIKLKSSETRRPTDVHFTEGWFAAELTLPEIVVDDTTAATFLNLIAYEMCPDFKNDYGICSFAVFMDSLIDHPEDVKELRSEGILLNSLGSDEEVAELFNTISTDLVPNSETYSDVRAKIHEHYCNKWKTWIALGYHTYFSNPWAIIGFLAAFVAVALTLVQTWFTIYPP
ncbi:UPF0481 protein At3g47200-like [Vicia villosa]|uniref:UPF0481 protein At3g47200-like n=1 Tax=Vicia villosa TaxID=3911 RepID=UPI00273CD521|nr:UPF0481 protein At3g47200-like [Vicia villosa]